MRQAHSPTLREFVAVRTDRQLEHLIVDASDLTGAPAAQISRKPLCFPVLQVDDLRHLRRALSERALEHVANSCADKRENFLASEVGSCVLMRLDAKQSLCVHGREHIFESEKMRIR